MAKRTTPLLAAALLGAATAILPMVAVPTADADICAGPGGRYFDPGRCTNAAGDAVETVISVPVPHYFGEIPCYTIEGVPYYTPPGYPC